MTSAKSESEALTTTRGGQRWCYFLQAKKNSKSRATSDTTNNLNKQTKRKRATELKGLQCGKLPKRPSAFCVVATPIGCLFHRPIRANSVRPVCPADALGIRVSDSCSHEASLFLKKVEIRHRPFPSDCHVLVLLQGNHRESITPETRRQSEECMSTYLGRKIDESKEL